MRKAIQAMARERGELTHPPVLLTVTARRRQVEIWRARAVRALELAQNLADEAWMRGEHAAADRWEVFCLKALRYVEQCRRALKRLG